MEHKTLYTKFIILLSAILWLNFWFVAPVTAIPKVESWQTANGAQVLWVATPELPMLDVRVVFNAGSAREVQPGVAILTNSLLSQGAGIWDANQISERLESVGAELSSGSLKDMSWFSLRTLTIKPALDTALEIITTILGQPLFSAKDLERLRNTLLVGLNQEEQQPGTMGSKAFYQALYGDHPYAHSATGTKESVAKITREQILEHYHRYYVAKNAVIAIVGAIDRPQAEQIAQQITSGLDAGEKVQLLPPVVDLTRNQLELLDFPITQSHIYIGQVGITRDDPDYFPLYVGNHILGGNGLLSILGKEIREQRGLSYNVYSYFLPMQRPGPFIMGLQTKNTQAKQALELLLQILRRFIQAGPSDQELMAAKRNITGSFPLSIASNSTIAEYLGLIGFYNLPLDYLETLTAKINAVTAQQIQSAFQRRINPEKLVTVIVGSLQ
ncbi:zinc protease [Achromatium sp. WMS1]|nr:zinc protease [Achromatium sp. WMS1]